MGLISSVLLLGKRSGHEVLPTTISKLKKLSLKMYWLWHLRCRKLLWRQNLAFSNVLGMYPNSHYSPLCLCKCTIKKAEITVIMVTCLKWRTCSTSMSKHIIQLDFLSLSFMTRKSSLCITQQKADRLTLSHNTVLSLTGQWPNSRNKSQYKRSDSKTAVMICSLPFTFWVGVTGVIQFLILTGWKGLSGESISCYSLFLSCQSRSIAALKSGSWAGGGCMKTEQIFVACGTVTSNRQHRVSHRPATNICTLWKSIIN